METKKELSKSSDQNRNNENHSAMTFEVSITDTSTISSVRTKRVVDSKIKKTMLLTLIVLGIFSALFPNAGLGPVLGSIASGLHDSKNMSWYMTVFSLASSEFTILYFDIFICIKGDTLAISQLLSVRISDCLGRRRTLLAATCLALIFTLISGFSVNSEMFIACRLIQVLGSVFVDHLSWRYIFWFTAILFAPVNIGFYYLIDIPLKAEQRLSKENLKTLTDRIDPVGCFLIASGLALFLLAMYLGSASSSYTWSSPLVIGFFAGFGLLFLLFLIFEKFITPRPLFPSAVILDIHLILCYIQQFICGWNFILCDLLVFIQYQAVYNLTPTEASIQLLPVSLIHIIATVLAGRISYRFENPKAVTIAGNILNVIAVSLILFVQKMDTNAVTRIVLMSIFEVGMALCDVASALCYQMVLEKKVPHLVATSTSLARCSMSCGITIGVAYVLSLLQSQSITGFHALEINQPDAYNEIMAYGAAYNYDRIKDVPSSSVRQILNLMYFVNIRNIIYGFFVSSLVSLFCAIFAKIPSIVKVPSDKSVENKDSL
ncbi:hypothetical protein K501DRAFT_274507 [Backusella circina FSU 941]|nr:hypothetical protein K501DRAFT_274507 [Backusella circina FSU 941]